eukprot:CFRG1001T1
MDKHDNGPFSTPHPNGERQCIDSDGDATTTQQPHHTILSEVNTPETPINGESESSHTSSPSKSSIQPKKSLLDEDAMHVPNSDCNMVSVNSKSTQPKPVLIPDEGSKEEIFTSRHANLPWWPMPMKEQKVPLCGFCRKDAEEGFEDLDDPYQYNSCHCWWWSYVVFGADEKTLVLEDNGNMQKMCEANGWTYPPVGRKRRYNVVYDVREVEICNEYGRSKLNATNLFDFKFIPPILRRSYEVNISLFLIVMAIFLSLSTIIYLIIVYALMPLGDDPTRCASFKSEAMWVYFTNPLHEVAIAFCHSILLYACLDESQPWRPFKFYAPLLVIVYLVQIAVFSAVGATIVSFEFQGLVMRLITLVLELCYNKYMQEKIVTFRQCVQTEDDKAIDDCEAKRFVAFEKYLVFEYILFVMYAAYVVGIHKLDGAYITAVNMVVVLLTMILRAILQTMLIPFHKDMQFMLTFVTIYGFKATFTAFVSPSFGSSFGAFFSAAVTPLTSIILAFMHHSELWFRFRCWIKTVYTGAVCMPTKYKSLSVYEDFDFNGRGNNNALPDYQRTKLHNDFLEIYAQLCGYIVYLCVAPVLRWGPNKDHFPYSSENIFLPDSSTITDDQLFTDEEFRQSVYFALLNIAYLGLGLMALYPYIKKFYPFLTPVLDEFVSVFWRYPHKLSCLMMLLSIANSNAVKMVVSFSRIYWFETKEFC